MTRRGLVRTAALCLAAGAVPALPGCARRLDDADLLDLDAVGVVAQIRRGELSAENYVRRLIQQQHAHKSLNAIITIDESRILGEARAVDQARARGQKLGALAGLPFGVKDQIEVAGYPTTVGNRTMQRYVAKRNAVVIDTLIRAGAIVFAKTNQPDMIVMDNLMAGVASNNAHFGDVGNPYDPRRIPGGTSGGNGAAIAARIVPAGIGEDTSGSVRTPAAMCGIAGLRPSTYTAENLLRGTSRQRYSNVGLVPPPGIFETLGPMARTVADLALLDTVITGEPVPAIDLRRTRIGIPTADYWDNEIIDQGVASLLQTAFAKLRDAGAQLVEVDFTTLSQVTDVGMQLFIDLMLSALEGVPRTAATDFDAWLAQNVPGLTSAHIYKESGRSPPRWAGVAPGITVAERNDKLERMLRIYSEVIAANGIAALAFPSIPVPAPLRNPQGEREGQTILVNGRPIDAAAAIIFNQFWGPPLGAPGLNIPAGLVSGGPVGLALQGMPGDDSRLLGIGTAVETILGRIPPPPGL